MDYDNHSKSVAEQIEEEVITDINETTKIMITFLITGMKLDSTELSPFATTFNSLKSLACTYYFYLPKELQKDIQDHNYTNGNVPTEPSVVTVPDDDEVNGNTDNDTLEYACKQGLQ